MKENQEAHARSEAIPPSVRAEDRPIKETMRKHGPAIALATALLASYALVLNSISDLRADFRTGLTDLRQDFRTEFERVDGRFERMDSRFERMDARLYELNDRMARIEGHLALTRAPAAVKNSSLDENRANAPRRRIG